MLKGGYLNSVKPYRIDDKIDVDKHKLKIEKINEIQSEYDKFKSYLGAEHIIAELETQLKHFNKNDIDKIDINKINELKKNIDNKLKLQSTELYSGKIKLYKLPILKNIIIEYIKYLEKLLQIPNYFYDNRTNLTEDYNIPNGHTIIIDDLKHKYPMMNFRDIFRINNIDRYMIIEEYKHNPNITFYYELKSNNISDNIDENYYFRLNKDFSLTLINKPEIIKDSNAVFQNTHNTNYSNFIEGKYLYDSLFFYDNLISKIKKTNPEQQLIFNLLNKFYAYDLKTNSFLYDVVLYHDSIVILLVFLNIITFIFDFLNKKITLERCDVKIDEIFNIDREYYANGYNYYKTANILRSRKITISSCNELLKKDVNSTLQEFKNEVIEFCQFLEVVEKTFPLVSKYILTDYLMKLYNSNIEFYLINKIKLFEFLFGYFTYNKDETRYKITDYNFTQKNNVVDLKNNYQVLYCGRKFLDCAENTLLNLFTYLLKKPDDTFKLELLVENSSLYNFFNNYKTYGSLLKDFSYIPIKVKTLWMDVVSYIDNVEYQTPKKCELKPNEQNIIKIINKLLEREFTKFEEIVNYFIPNSTINREKGFDEHEPSINYRINNEVRLMFRSGHSEYYIIKENKIDKSDCIIKYDMIMSVYYILFNISEKNKELLLPLNEEKIYSACNDLPLEYHDNWLNISMYIQNSIFKFFKFIDISRLTRKENLLLEGLELYDDPDYFNIFEQIINNRDMFIRYLKENDKLNETKHISQRVNIINSLFGNIKDNDINLTKKINLFKKVFRDFVDNDELRTYIKNSVYTLQKISINIDYDNAEDIRLIDDYIKLIDEKVDVVLILSNTSNYKKCIIFVQKLISSNKLSNIQSGYYIERMFNNLINNINNVKGWEITEENLNYELDIFELLLGTTYFDEIINNKHILILFMSLDKLWDKRPTFIKLLLQKYKNLIQYIITNSFTKISNHFENKDLREQFTTYGIKFNDDNTNQTMQGGNSLYKEKYLKYKEKYILLKKNML